MRVDLNIHELCRKINDDNQIWYCGDTIFIPFNVYFLTWKDIEEKAKDYNNIFFTTSEHFLNEELIPVLRRWVDSGKKIYFKHFTFGYTKYLQKVIGSDNIIAPDLELTFLTAAGNCNMMRSYENRIHHHNTKQILLNYMTFNRTLSKDYVMDKIILPNNLQSDDRNLISFHNYEGKGEKNTSQVLKKSSYLYDRPEHREFISKFNINLDRLTDLKIIPQSENFNISGEQGRQKDRLCEIHHQTMFNIISEACVPYSEDIENIWYYNASISPKTIWPLYFKNVFYYTPNPKIFNESLEELGFKTFFNNDSEFLQSLNEEYYYSTSVQEKLFHNHMQLKKILDNNSMVGKESKNIENWIQKHIKLG